MNSNRILGCIFGGALGDAYGGPYESSQPPVTIDENATWRLSDDTQLTLATCEAISQAGTIDPAVLSERFSFWYKANRLSGLGASTLKALTELAHGGHWALVGRKGEMAAGNGAAMRVAPLAFLLDPTNPQDRRLIRDVSRITHHNEEAYVGALAVCTAVHAAYHETWTGHDDLIGHVINLLPDSRVRDRLEAIQPLAKNRSIPEIAQQFGNSAYVVNSVPLAICTAQKVNELSFQPMLENIISCGGDTDTNASIAGQIAGTLLGYKTLPNSMLENLPHKEMIDKISKAFLEEIKKQAGNNS